ncbi:SusC/RagA family TonB-linked outer membrane protein [Terrimonas sp. NA20]|uniref:SusC/RagA family TonB-linked outer membrane protein n=1 Tax=Terrimonas ginsenosidimutans TaxID=2908004 RepID=A0ABS9KLD8_9BACT|nr:SusC/RagA family TonB-linked outer membrane protein [Terrimonas ginsenosidimutans]MCG2613127.1 SusC/RagA family TonB-linked outer membrane protein [Terrimonas ginsenosidimutans]
MQLHTILRALAFACLLFSYVQVSASGHPGQGITLSVTQEKMEKVFKEIESQVDVSFVYTRETLMRAKPVTISVKGEQLDRILPALFRDQPVSYLVDGSYIIIRAIVAVKDTTPVVSSFKGKLINEAGNAIAGATVQVKGTASITSSDNNGAFSLRDLSPNATLLITGAELEPMEIKVGNETFMTITLKPKVNELDQVLVMAYGETTRRLNTGSIGKVSAEEIQRQPVSNPLAALHGRVPGVIVTQSSGVPGAHVKIEIRGQNSITQGSDPLFVIDGIPFGPNNNIVNQISSVAGRGTAVNPGGLSPFNSINPGDIESIEILKDADATSIYGSRGANGVVLITTKKGKAGKTQVTVNAFSGFSKLTRVMPMLNTQQYVMMRKEAFANDGIVMDAINAPEIVLWDTTRYTDLNKVLMGHTPRVNDIQLAVSGGNQFNQFILRTAYHRETTPFPGDMFQHRSSVHFNFNHTSADNRFKLLLNTGYSADINNLVNSSLPNYTSLQPNLPALYTATGELNWFDQGVMFENPMAYLYREYRSVTSTLLANTVISYRLIGDLSLRALAGYNSIDIGEQDIIPKRAFAPGSPIAGSTQLSDQRINSWSIEPQVEWIKKAGNLKLTFLGGMTVQTMTSTGLFMTGAGFASDALIKDVRSASSVTANNSVSEYRYLAGFARINFNVSDKYLLNLSGRRDGSTRFGPGNRYANFGAVGAAWVFSKDLDPGIIPGLSFGKLRASYGTTGNDQIGNYQFLDTWSPISGGFQGSLALRPTRLYNPDYNWEINKKAEIALELGFFKDRLLLSAAYFRNRSDNQLINYNISSQTGFASTIKNFPAVVQNTGVEISFTATIYQTPELRWSVNSNISFPDNKLVEFPGIENTSYASQLEVGRPLRLIKSFEFLGVNPQTGVYHFTDVNLDGLFNSLDRKYLGSLVPKYTGGISQQLAYREFQLDVFFMFVRQTGRNFRAYGAVIPGDVLNQPAYVLNRWQKPGDITDVQKFSSDFSSDAYKILSTLNSSSGVYGDASFWRLKNLSLSYSFPRAWLAKIKASQCRLFLQGQNLLTFTSFLGSDPENQALYGTLPLMKTFTGGIQVTF